MTSAGSYDKRTKLNGTEANAPGTHDASVGTGNFFKEALSVEVDVWAFNLRVLHI